MEKQIILALDCSLRWTNVAVCSGGGGKILISERHDLGRRQAAELPAVVDSALSKAGFSFAQIGVIAVTNGPGYFTGIRVGASYAAALAYGLGIKIIPVPTLHMLAHSLNERTPRERPFLVAVYAGRERVYAASFGNEEDSLPTGEYGKDDINSWLSANVDAALASDAPEKTFLPELFPEREILTASPDAADAARIARQRPDTAVSPMELRIAYHRSPL